MRVRPVFRSTGYFIGSESPLLLIKSFATVTCEVTKKVWEYIKSENDYEDWISAADKLISEFEKAEA